MKLTDAGEVCNEKTLDIYRGYNAISHGSYLNWHSFLPTA